MTLEQLIKTASKGYSEDLIYRYFQNPQAQLGDSLAKFIMQELSSTFGADRTDREQLNEGCRILLNARQDIAHVQRVLEKETRKCRE